MNAAFSPTEYCTRYLIGAATGLLIPFADELSTRISNLCWRPTVSHYEITQANIQRTDGGTQVSGSAVTRFIKFQANLIVENQLDPFIEELQYRTLGQYYLPHVVMSALGVDPNSTLSTIVRVAGASLWFAIDHGSRSEKMRTEKARRAGVEPTDAEVKAVTNYAVALNIGRGLIFGALYEKYGIMASFGAHAITNYFWDAITRCDWKTKEQTLAQVLQQRFGGAIGAATMGPNGELVQVSQADLQRLLNQGVMRA